MQCGANLWKLCWNFTLMSKTSMPAIQRYTALLLLCLAVPGNGADKIRIAVASNFVACMKNLDTVYVKQSQQQTLLSFASTGKHYAQIINGAPFDVFLAADVQRPQILEQKGYAVRGSRFTYALGQLVLWSPMKSVDDNTLQHGHYRRLAIANPRLAPYGQAAMEALKNLKLELKPSQLVRGENINQAYQYVLSGNADLGLLAYSQIKPQIKSQLKPLIAKTDYWLLPDDLYQSIEQQAIQLQEGEAASAFMKFLRSATARDIIQDCGYRAP